MKSGKQRRVEILAKRKRRAAKLLMVGKEQARKFRPFQVVPVNEELLMRSNSYDVADFVRRGYYVDVPFRCVGCGKEEVWTGTQQKWWYEVAKGFVYTTANRCRACRGKERERRDEERRIHLEGVARKQNFTKR